MEELCHMLARERETARRTLENPRGLVVPVVIHDGDDFPPEIRQIQYFDISACFNVRMSQNSPRAEQLDEVMGREAAAIAKAINTAPDWQSKWPTMAVPDFYRVYYSAEAPVQTTVPALV